MPYTRSFTEMEQNLVTRGLLALRAMDGSDLTGTERAVLDGILRDGWIKTDNNDSWAAPDYTPNWRT